MTLATHFSNEERQLLHLAADHAGLIFEIASFGAGWAAGRARTVRASAPGAPAGSSMTRTSWSSETREAVRRRPDYAVFLSLLESR